MSTVNERRTLIAEIEQRLCSEDLTTVQARVEEIHIQYHDDARMHFHVHRWRLRMALRQRQWGQMVLEILAVPFIAPVSWVQRHWGLALASRMNRPPR